ncbi:MAG: peptidoglycan-binding protein, partial [Halanaerobiales bacterium]|nr:peptidoglycan-binding protein [Halanaerobiales bacterium]
MIDKSGGKMSESNHCRFLFSWLLFLAIILLTGEVIGQEQCSCREDRVLELQSPYYRGKDIRDLQQRLKEMGYYHAVIDGIYGLLTAEAVGRFQQENQLKADGIMDQISWDLLGH